MQTRGRPFATLVPRRTPAVLACLLTLLWASGLRGQTPGEAPVALLMIEDHGCPYCARWDREVRSGYANSAEGRFAPLLRRLRGSPDISFLTNVVYTPTFVLLVRGQEVGRIVGYPGADFFWAELGVLLARAGYANGKTPG